MIKIAQKRVLMSLSFVLLFVPITSIKTHDSSANNGTFFAGLIGASIGLIYGLVKYFQKSPEQIANDAEGVLCIAHMYGRCFYIEYVTVFEQTRFGGDLNYVECNFLEAVVRRAQEPLIHIDIEEHIDEANYFLVKLEKALIEVKKAIEKLRSQNETHQPIYDRLVSIMHNSEAQLAYLNGYHQRFAEHRAYFKLSKFESKLIARYQYECTHMSQNAIGLYQFEKQLLQIAKMRNGHGDYPLVEYHLQLCNDIETLECHMSALTYRYPERTLVVNHMFSYLSHIRDILADIPVFREERERKKEDDARKEILALKKREFELQGQVSMLQGQVAVLRAQAMYA